MSSPNDPDDTEERQSWARSLFGLGRANGGSRSDTAAPDSQMRLRIAEFEAGRVESVMIPRADIIAVEIGTDFDALTKTFADATHSRLPVYRETLDDPVGFVHIKDVVTEIARDGETEPNPLERLHRKILFVPASMKLSDLLLKMQSTRIHLALVVDEYGGTDGLVSLEDLVEEIVGDIEDEHDDDTAMVIRRGPELWEADARTEIEDFQEAAGLDLSLPDYEDEIGTLGGVAFALAGKIPVRGEVLRHPAGAEIEIMDADARRIRRLRLRLGAETPRDD